MSFLRKYATGTGSDVYIPLIKRAVVDFAVGADWTPAAGDVKVSIDGTAAANIGTLPVAVVMGNTAMWKFVFTNAELTGKYISVTVADAATKAVEDQMFAIETYGNASALHPFDLAAATVTLAAATHTGAVIPTVTTATNVTTVNGLAAGVITAASIAADAITDAKVAADVTIASVTGAVGSVIAGVTVTTNNDKAGYALSAAGVDAVWDEPTAGHATAGTTGKALTDAGSAGDPWSTALPGAYTAGQAGKIVGDNLNATVSSRATPAQVATELATYDGPTNAEMEARTIASASYATASDQTAIKAKTDSLTFTVAGQVDSNIQSINDVTVLGNGAGTPWGP